MHGGGGYGGGWGGDQVRLLSRGANSYEAVLRATEEAMEAMVVVVMEGVTMVVMVEVDMAAAMVMGAMEAAAMTGDKI